MRAFGEDGGCSVVRAFFVSNMYIHPLNIKKSHTNKNEMEEVRTKHTYREINAYTRTKMVVAWSLFSIQRSG